MAIRKFENQNRFLSNFCNTSVTYNGLTYANSEAAFQAQKSQDIEVQKSFLNLNPMLAKQRGKRVALRKDIDWESAKYDIMYAVCKAKFEQNEDLRNKLIATGDEYLEEGNSWGDRDWGTVNGVGKNMLGKILMKIREEFKCSDTNLNCFSDTKEVIQWAKDYLNSAYTDSKSVAVKELKGGLFFDGKTGARLLWIDKYLYDNAHKVITENEFRQHCLPLIRFH